MQRLKISYHVSNTFTSKKMKSFLSKFDISVNSMDASYIPISKAKVFSMNWIIFLISNIVSDISSNIHKFLSPSADIPLQNAQTCKYSFRPQFPAFTAVSLPNSNFTVQFLKQTFPVSAYPVPGSDSHNRHCRTPLPRQHPAVQQSFAPLEYPHPPSSSILFCGYLSLLLLFC